MATVLCDNESCDFHEEASGLCMADEIEIEVTGDPKCITESHK